MRFLALGLVMLLASCGGEVDSPQPSSNDVVAAAPGRIEGAADTHRVGTSAQGVVRRLLVAQGDKVTAGQLLVELDCAEVAAEAEGLRHRAAAAGARHARATEGFRAEEIREAFARSSAARAEAARATANMQRAQALHAQQFISEAAVDAAATDEKRARGEADAADARVEMMRAGARIQDIEEAASEAKALRMAAAAALRRLGSCSVLSPVDGEIVRVHVTAGELVSPLVPAPLVSVADLAMRRIRAEVDERDIGRIRVGQAGRVLVESFPGRVIDARVLEISPAMGRKRTHSLDPAERSDRDVLEVMLTVDPSAPPMPLGLRVTVQFIGEDGGDKKR